MTRHLFNYLIIFLLTAQLSFDSQAALKSAGSQPPVSIYILSEAAHPGDRAQALSVVESMKKSAAGCAFKIQELELANLRPKTLQTILRAPLPAALSPCYPKKSPKSALSGIWLIAAGEKATEVLAKLDLDPKLHVVHLAHKLFPKHAELLGRIDFLVLPQEAMTEAFKKRLRLAKKTRWLPTAGVFHQMDRTQIDQAYEELRSQLSPGRQYIAIVLAGDVMAANQQTRRFSRNEAQQLARRFAKAALGQNIVVLNGPRTGRHLDPNAHRSTQVDEVSAAFLRELKHCVGEEKVKFFNFQIGIKSLYPGVLGLIRAQKTQVWIPGESASMLAEALSVLPGQVIVYENAVMSPADHIRVRQLWQNHKLRLFSLQSARELPPPQLRPEVAAAEAILTFDPEQVSEAILGLEISHNAR